MWQLLPEWLDMVVRWTHVITGIAWIGSSFYFNWLESKFRPPETPRERIEGELAAHPGLRAWIERVSPGLTGSYPALTSVRIADLGGPADAERTGASDAAAGGPKGATREG